MKGFPAIVAAPERAVPVFWPHDTVTDPVPLPALGDTVTHDPFPDAVQLPPVHPLGIPFTATDCDPAVEPGFARAGEMEKLVHAGGDVPAWVTVKALPAIVALSEREAADAFALHETVTAPDPLPLVGATLSHEPFPLADQLPPAHPDGDPTRLTT